MPKDKQPKLDSPLLVRSVSLVLIVCWLVPTMPLVGWIGLQQTYFPAESQLLEYCFLTPILLVGSYLLISLLIGRFPWAGRK